MAHLMQWFHISLASSPEVFFEVLEDGDRERQDNEIFGEEGVAIRAHYDIPCIRKHRIQLTPLTNNAIHFRLPFKFFM